MAHSSALAAGATTFSFPVDAEPDESYTGALMSDGTNGTHRFSRPSISRRRAAGYDGETILGAGNHNIIYFSDDYESDGAVRGFNFALESDDSAYSQSFEGLQMDVTTSICDGLPGYGDDDDDDDDDDVLQSVLLTGQLLGCMVENATETCVSVCFKRTAWIGGQSRPSRRNAQLADQSLRAAPRMPLPARKWKTAPSGTPSNFMCTSTPRVTGTAMKPFWGPARFCFNYFDGPYTQDNAREGYNFYSPKSVVHYSQRFADLLIDVVASDCE